ncbi:hypothetical protein M3Y97_00596400 [Aphelenchoides bicaudatus]|nr:hypothetical protein M3Y97_00596400 [Aphelenchoides bicaudatus]
MSVNSGPPSVPTPSKNNKNVEILEPGVSLVKPQRRYRRSVAILTPETDQKKDNDHNIPTSEFNIFHSQSSTQGVLTIEQNTTGGERNYIKYDLMWLQDDENSRLLFNVTDPITKTSEIYYVFKTHTLHVTAEETCDFLEIGYEAFIYLFGVVLLSKSDRNDIIKVHDKYEVVEVFEGVPRFNYSDLHLIMPGYDNGLPKFAFAYSLPKQGSSPGMTIGWQVYFDSHDKQDKNHIEWVEYWFSDMIEGQPEAEKFVDYTGDCVQHDGSVPTTASATTLKPK